MRVRVKFFATFRELFGAKEREVTLDKGAGVQELLGALCDSDKCRQRIFDESGKIRRDVKVLRRGRHVQLLGELNSELEDGDVVSLFPSMFGG